MWEMHKPIVRIAILLSIVLVTACQNTDSGQVAFTPLTEAENFPTPTILPVKTHTQPPSGEPTPSETIIPIPSSMPTAIPIPERELDIAKPWLLQTSKDFAWTIYNLDGTGETTIELRDEIHNGEPWDNFYSIETSGRYVSAILDIPEDPQLFVFELPNEHAILQIPLVGNQAREAIDDFVPFEVDPAIIVIFDPVLTAIGDMAWSPDGRYLAFTGAMDGPSSDIYLIDMDTQQTHRLTGGPNQARIMGWSPDSETILHYSVEWQVDYMELIESLWAVDVRGNVRELMDYDELMINPYIGDWIDETTLVMFYPDFESNSRDLTMLDIQTGETEIIDAPMFRDGIFFDQSTDHLLINFGPMMGGGKNVGVYSYDLANSTLQTILDGARLIGRIENTPYFISMNGEILTPEGEVVASISGEVFDIQLPVASPDGEWVLAYIQHSGTESGGVTSSLLGPDGEQIQEWDFACRKLVWVEDSSGFFCYVPDIERSVWKILFISHENDWEPILVNTLFSGNLQVIYP
jgi:WD40 repeat protein